MSRIQTNVAALNAHRNLANTQGMLNKSIAKLSSGFRINRASDDAAGLSIEEVGWLCSRYPLDFVCIIPGTEAEEDQEVQEIKEEEEEHQS